MTVARFLSFSLLLLLCVGAGMLSLLLAKGFPAAFPPLAAFALLALAMWFLFLSHGTNSRRLLVGLGFLLLSPLLFLGAQSFFSGQNWSFAAPFIGFSGFQWPSSCLVQDLLYHAHISGIPVWLLSAASFLALNGALVVRGAPLSKFLGGNLLLLALVLWMFHEGSRFMFPVW